MKITAYLSIVALALGCNSASTPLNAEHEAPIEHQIPEEAPALASAPLEETTTAFGEVVLLPNAQDQVYSMFPGRVLDVRVLEGDIIARNQTLLVIASPDFIEVQRQFLDAQSVLAFCRAEFDRVSELQSNGALSQQTYDESKNRLHQAEARLAATSATLSLAGVNPAGLSPNALRQELTVTGALGGTVTQINVNRGDWVESSTSLIEIADLQSTIIEAFLPIDRADRMHEGDTCTLSRPGAAEQYSGRVAAVVAAASSNRIKVRIDPDRNARDWRPGEPVVAAFK